MHNIGYAGVGQIADRIIVFRDGRIAGELINNKDYDLMSKSYEPDYGEG